MDSILVIFDVLEVQ